MAYRRLIFLIVISCMGAMACSSSDGDTIVQQQTRIESYLNNNNILEYDEIQGAYRYIVNTDRDGYGSSSVIAQGDVVKFFFACYEFGTTRVLPAFYSNRQDIIDELRDSYGLSAVYWSRDPMEVTVGKTKLLKAVENALPGCRQGDSVRLFLTNDLAFGEEYVANLPLNSAMEYNLKIEEVIKQ